MADLSHLSDDELLGLWHDHLDADAGATGAPQQTMDLSRLSDEELLAAAQDHDLMPRTGSSVSSGMSDSAHGLAVMSEDGGAGDGSSEPSALGASGDALAGSGIPTLRKPFLALGSRTRWTSPASVAARQTFLKNVKIPRIPTPTIGSLDAVAGDAGTLAGRALPLVGAAAIGADVYLSDNKPRTLVGDLSGLGGAALGATLASPSVVGTIAGGAAGGYVGNKLGLAAYDYFVPPDRHRTAK